MKKLSPYDCEFLRSIHVLAESKRRHWSDEIFLRSCGIAPLRYHTSDGESRLAGIYQHPLDGTQRLLAENNIPLTRENYLRLAFAGKPPEEPLDGEIEAMLPESLTTERLGEPLLETIQQMTEEEKAEFRKQLSDQSRTKEIADASEEDQD